MIDRTAQPGPRDDKLDDNLAELGDIPHGVSADEFREQAEIDALLRLDSGQLAARADLAERVSARWAARGSLWRRMPARLRLAIEVAAAAVIVIGLGVWYFMLMGEPFQLDGPAQVSDDAGRPARLVSGAWVRTADQPATLKIRGHTRIAMAPHTRLKVEGGARAYRVSLDDGRIECRTDSRAATVEIATVAGSVTADGGESSFAVQIANGPSGKRLTATAIAGRAALAGTSGTQTLTNGAAVTLALNDQPDKTVQPAEPDPKRAAIDDGKGSTNPAPASQPGQKLRPNPAPRGSEGQEGPWRNPGARPKTQPEVPPVPVPPGVSSTDALLRTGVATSSGGTFFVVRQ